MQTSSSMKRGGGHARDAPQRWPEQPLLSPAHSPAPCKSAGQGLSDQPNEGDMMWQDFWMPRHLATSTWFLGTLPLGTLPLETQPPHAEDPKPHGEDRGWGAPWLTSQLSYLFILAVGRPAIKPHGLNAVVYRADAKQRSPSIIRETASSCAISWNHLGYCLLNIIFKSTHFIHMKYCKQ